MYLGAVACAEGVRVIKHRVDVCYARSEPPLTELLVEGASVLEHAEHRLRAAHVPASDVGVEGGRIEEHACKVSDCTKGEQLESQGAQLMAGCLR